MRRKRRTDERATGLPHIRPIGRRIDPDRRVWDVLDARRWRFGRFEWMAVSNGYVRWLPQPFFQMFDRF